MPKTGTDKLMTAAAVALRKIGRPATVREIIDEVRLHPKLRSTINGRTPHKTLNARISVDILRYGSKSAFYRFAPSTFGLRDLINRPDYPKPYRQVYFGRQRRKEVSNEWVAVVKPDHLRFLVADGLYEQDHFPLSILRLADIFYCQRRFVENRSDVRQLVSYACLIHDQHVLSFERGKYVADGGEFIGKQSIGFGGHLSYDDLSLFDESPGGFTSNVLRELHEELYIFRKELRDSILGTAFVGFLQDTSTKNGKCHVGLAAAVHLQDRIELETLTLGIKNLRWISLHSTPNSFSNFEIWSQYLFRHLQESYA